jgi:hypothetical protein
MSCTTYNPATSGVKVGFSAVGLVKVAVLVAG